MPSPSSAEPAAYTIRPMRWFDVESVAALDHVAFSPDTWNRDFFWAQLAGPANRFWVAEETGGAAPIGASSAGAKPVAGEAGSATLLGYAGLSIAGGESEILTIATAPAARGRGIAKALIATMTRAARARGAQAMYLDVRADNDSALGLYTSFGFSELGRRPGYYHGSDAIIMRALLN